MATPPFLLTLARDPDTVMVTWVVYDISNDKVRGKVAKMCKEYGLYRVQKSAFLGDINKNEKDELVLRCKEIVQGEDDSVYVFPMCDDDYKKVRIIGKAFDKDVVADEVKALFV